MGTFSTSMRTVALNLLTQLGNPCTLTKTTLGQYNPQTGATGRSDEEIKTFSAPEKVVSENFGEVGINTNLVGFSDNKVVIPWIGQEIDETWLYNGNNITSISPTETQGDVVIYTITVGEK